MNFTIARRNEWPVRGRNLFTSDIDRFFSDFFALDPVERTGSLWNVHVDIEEDEKSYHVTAELPGIDEKEISVELKDGYLTISGEKKEEKRDENSELKHVYSERHFGSFCRTISVPDSIDSEKIEARYKSGVLYITLPKAEAAKPRKIEVSIN